MKNQELIRQYSEMSDCEREFILKNIEKYKPKKILTCGIAAGANESLILNFLEKKDKLDRTKLFSIDYNRFYYRDLFRKSPDPRLSGFLVDECVSHLKHYWTLHTGGIAANHIEQVGKGIDFCIIDTVHSAPGEALDFLMILPFLAENAVMIMHDLTYHLLRKHIQASNICNILFSAFNGIKEYPESYILNFPDIPESSQKALPLFQNMGACVLAKNQLERNNLMSYFKILNLPWNYMPNDRDIELCKKYFSKHYGSEFVFYFREIVNLQKKWIQESKSNENIKLHKEASKVKNHLSYKLGQALIKASNNAWGGGYVKLPFEIIRIIKEFRKNKN